ncbi:GNAT family N-acetyltransferase [Hyunsoonleella pacifica]|uniref:N-acetyltransferase family protein n=1 Tax=Hyunsoonleella pacifica TaxID=1080224 RepID=A0A4Q9FR74_9FLAO|nr:GNAT family N-acetyltransferase [Hyunsoonleella pacifica]TBN18558.1 N-acetyltransferase family protein [Hyunsoonleella pacifica]GGD02811.1 N-acetyltransferase [Hyunsoonleella pacifica]
MVRHFTKDDISALLDIYNYYVSNTVATFDIEPLSFEVFEAKVNRINSEYPFLVFEEHQEILGFAYASRFRPKPAYNFTVESTVYVKHNAHGKHIGSKLYEALIKKLKQTETHTVIGALTIPNDASVRLHEKFGFREVALLKEVGLKFGKWHDVAMYQLRLST